jgi:hypothetical protein
LEHPPLIWNIVDRRRNHHRWRKIHAVVEATWHDNPASGADQAPESGSDADVTFDERSDISINAAIAWANSQSSPVTLYISDGSTLPPSSSAEVDAAARILDRFGRHLGWWPTTTPSFDDLDPPKKADFRFIVEGMLRAAATERTEGAASSRI